MADLVWHLTEVHHFWASVVQQRSADGRDVARVDRVADVDLLANFELHLARLVDVLSQTDPATPVWTWSAQHDVAFVLRRMAHETAVHRWDAESAAGQPTAIGATLASDGIDEFLAHFLDDIAEGAEPVSGSVHIHCTDVDGEWTIRPRASEDGHDDGSPGFDVTREHAKGDCAMRGAASDILLALWRRSGDGVMGAIDVIGDVGVATRFLASTNLD